MTVQLKTGKILILLVGTNPLPNYVVAKYLSDKGLIKRIFLVHSELTENQSDTYFQAKILDNLLKDQFCHIKVELIPLSNVSNGTDIRNDIHNKLLPRLEPSNLSNIHLNYTGGTKVMAVHIYNYLNIELASSFDSSYLSAQNHKLSCDGIQTDYCQQDLRKKVNINIDTLLSLHNLCVLTKRGRRQVRTSIQNEFTPTLTILTEYANDPETMNDFIEWFRRKIRPIYWYRGEFNPRVKFFLNHIQQERIQKLINQYDKHPTHVALLKNLPSNHWLINENDPHNRLWRPNESVTNNEFESRLKKSLEFLDGKWLEHYIASILKESIEDRKEEEMCSWGMSLKSITSDVLKRYKNQIRDFEIDNFVIRGYQFFGISVTTSLLPQRWKRKAFEVLHRSSQIGGDESRSILICPIHKDDVEPFKIYFTSLMGHLEDKFLVICRHDWKRDKLKKKLGDFIWKN